MVNEKVIQSYELERLFVATIRLESSALIEPPAPVYCETIVWEWDSITRQTGRLIGMSETCKTNMCGVKNHASICESLVKNNGWKEPDEEEVTRSNPPPSARLPERSKP